ncbi:protein stoned-A [Thrips palmi]|uniref:Protein stoned-A n=1 Tax=Thrips palmi TaxID=161013 RepID=A0A6P8YTF7_THRPL|nr:protein stoned-A [Thrips palmi]
MLKIPKGLKKKKKGKKGKHKGDEDLFTPEELEEYKRQKALKEQQEQQEAEAAAEEVGPDDHAASTSSSDHGQGHGTAPAPAAASTNANAPASTSAPEDEDRFQALLGGVDSILNKTQRDLDRIKSTSYFQRKPTPSELQSKKAEGPPARPAAPTATAVAAASKKGKRWVGFGDGDEDADSEEEHPQHAAPAPAPAAAPQAAAFETHEDEEEEESEEEEDEGDDIFDTSYIDVITSGEVKLAYIPDSPTEQPDDGDDPFDTTYAAKVIGNDEDIKRKQKLEKVSLGIAVDVLTGKAAPPSKPPPLPDHAVAKRAVPRRVKPVDLLKLGSFDDSGTSEAVEGEAPAAEEPASLLDDDALAIPEDLPPVGTPIIPPASVLPAAPAPEEDKEPAEEDKHIDLSEFDVIADKPVVDLPVSNLALVAAALGGPPPPAPEEEDEFDDEFAALAQESLQKQKEDEDEFAVDGDDPFDTSVAAVVLGQPDEPKADVDVLLAGPQASWSAFDEDEHEHPHLKPSRPPPPRPAPPPVHANEDIDPFDTSIAHNILPGKTELKLIEKEILEHDQHNEARILSNSDSDFDFNPRAGEQPAQQQTQVSFYVTDPAGDIDHSPVVHRDLLGGSSSDLSQLGHDPIAPADTAAAEDEETALHDDPFDTSAVDVVTAPGRTELRYLEKEILGDVASGGAIAASAAPQDEDDFDPRAEEATNKAQRPDVLGVHKSVAFVLPSPAAPDLLGGAEEGTKFSKPLTPYYAEDAPDITADVDPFDTAHVAFAPGKTELKILENELVGSAPDIKPSLSDYDFDPRGAQAAAAAPVDQDLFKVEEGVGHRPLTPAVEEAAEIDPFDTSIASNIAPGKAELKVLENELITNDPQTSIKRTYTDPDFNPRDGPEQANQDLLSSAPAHDAKALTPVLGESSSLDGPEDDVDPFDTSIAADLGPGKTELRILESELIGRQ